VTGPAPSVAAVRVAVRAALADLVDRAGRPAGAPPPLVLVACSGGADSLALAAATAFEAPRAAVRAGAVVVDHGLQDGSAARARSVAGTLRGLGLDPVEVVAVQVGREGGPEAAARTARYAALDAAADRTGATAVLLGHTLDDQAETVLLGLARGSGARSLAGMSPRSGRHLRPLLGLRRATTRAACAAAGLEPWDDPHNADPAFARSRVRGRALPVLEDELGPGVAEALARTADLLRADADALDAWAADAAATVVGPDGSLDAVALAALPAAVRTRLLRSAALAAGSPAGDLAAVHVAALDALVTAWHGQGPVDLPGRVGARRACDRLLLQRRPPRDPHDSRPVQP
jgi:tRNA(Ile)-lysidine synthase